MFISMKKLFIAAICVITGIVGCTKDPNYSQEKLRNVNQEITIFEDGITVPLDSVKSVTFKEIVQPEKTPQVTLDQNGCFCLNLKGNLIPAIAVKAGGSKPVTANPVQEIKFKDVEIEIDLPDVLKDENNTFNFTDPGITVKINNPLSSALKFYGKISAYRNGFLKETAQFSNLDIEKGSNEIKITEDNCSNILKVIGAIPDKLILSDFYLAPSGQGGIEITGSTVSVEYLISTPFIFNAGTKLYAEQELKNKIEIGDGLFIDKAELVLEINNLTDFELTPVATINIDDEDVPLFDEKEGIISIGKNEKKTITCTICKPDMSKFQYLGDISLGITASVKSGTGHMKETTGVFLTIKSLCLPNGITVD